ncbi:MAG: hypothetical protein N4A47_03525 [Clostridia bacterium]|jgi:hypothetical protein|nr:hypothetical protein [Clostridia bacterium]
MKFYFKDKEDAFGFEGSTGRTGHNIIFTLDNKENVPEKLHDLYSDASLSKEEKYKLIEGVEIAYVKAIQDPKVQEYKNGRQMVEDVIDFYDYISNEEYEGDGLNFESD